MTNKIVSPCLIMFSCFWSPRPQKPFGNLETQRKQQQKIQWYSKQVCAKQRNYLDQTCLLVLYNKRNNKEKEHGLFFVSVTAEKTPYSKDNSFQQVHNLTIFNIILNILLLSAFPCLGTKLSLLIGYFSGYNKLAFLLFAFVLKVWPHSINKT